MKRIRSSDGFKTRIANCHGVWLESVLGIPYLGRAHGIDFANEDTAMELKCRLKCYSDIWACDENDRIQFEKEQEGKKMYWAFLLYSLDKRVPSLSRTQNLEPHVTGRDCWIVEWNVIHNFPVHSPLYSGPFRYAKEHLLDKKGFSLIEDKKGRVYVSEGFHS